MIGISCRGLKNRKFSSKTLSTGQAPRNISVWSLVVRGLSKMSNTPTHMTAAYIRLKGDWHGAPAPSAQ